MASHEAIEQFYAAASQVQQTPTLLTLLYFLEIGKYSIPGRRLTQKQLGDNFQQPRSKVSDNVNKLVKMHMIDREAVGKNFNLTLSFRGENLYRKICPST